MNFIKYFSYDVTYTLLELNDNILIFDEVVFEDITTQFFQSFDFDFLNYPWFLFGFFTLLISTCVSLLFLSYLGLYGVFCFNLTTMFTMWICLLITFIDIIANDSYYYIELSN